MEDEAHSERYPLSPFHPDAAGLWDTAHAASVWQRLTVVFLAFITLVTVHYAFFHLHAILVPFLLSGLIVFALQPSVEFVYEFLAGLAPPHRWFGCCCRRRQKYEEHQALYGTCCFTVTKSPQTSPRGPRQPTRRDVEALKETEPLLEQVPTMAAMFCEGFARFLAVFLALLFLLLLSSMFFMLLGKGALHMKENWVVYRTGLKRVERLQGRALDRVAKELGVEASVDAHVKDAYDHVLEQAQDVMWMVVNELVHSFSEGVTQFFVIMLYVMFWLMQPLPTGGTVSSVVRSYLWKKSLVSFLYGFFVTLLFVFLHVDLAVFFGIVSFFLNFVPEVGAFISMVVPIPVILLDGRLHNPFGVLVLAMTGQLFLKFIIGNILEVKLIERDREMNIHPVWIILGLSYFGYVWGPMGALLSVPLMAMVKTAALSVRGDVIDTESVVPALAEMFLACFEGRHTCWARPSQEAPSGAKPACESAPVPLFMPPPPHTPSEGSPTSPVRYGGVSPSKPAGSAA